METGEDLLATHSKKRPVILLNKTKSDWINPANTSRHSESWTCLPIFSYQDRHNQPYVLEDQKLNISDRFYLPPAYGNNIGLLNESSIHFSRIQQITPSLLSEQKLMNDRGINTPYKLSEFAMKIILFHYLLNIGLITNFIDEAMQEAKSYYDLFKERVNELLDKALDE